MKSKQVLSIEQMQHLQELGLDTSNASMVWGKYEGEEEYSHQLPRDENVFERCLAAKYIPAYTLKDVLDALPEEVKYKRKDYLIEMWKRDNEWTIGYLFFSADDTLDVLHLHDETNKSFIDAAYEMLCWCIENGYAKIGKEASDERADR